MTATSGMPYEEVVKVWAAQEFRLPVETIDSVTFDYEEGDSCPTCGYEGYPVAFIRLTDGRSLMENLRYDFAATVRALVQAALENGRSEP